MPVLLNTGKHSLIDKSSRLIIEVHDKQRPTYRFYPHDFIIDVASKFTITLEKSAIFEGIERMELTGYCTTHPEPGIVTVVRAMPTIGVPKEIGDQEQDIPFPTDTMAIEFELNLPNRLLVFIGVILKIKRTGLPDFEYYLCDPQVGNGPPGSGGLRDTVPMM